MGVVAAVMVPACAGAGTRWFLTVVLPWGVRVRFAGFTKPIAPGLVKFRGAVPEASRAVGLVLIVKRRSVLDPAPTYWSVPPLRRRLAAAELEAPSGLAIPPLRKGLTIVVPEWMDVAPVKPKLACRKS